MRDVFNWPTFDNSINIIETRNAMLDVLFEKNPECISFIASKEILGILNDDPEIQISREYDFSRVRVF